MQWWILFVLAGEVDTSRQESFPVRAPREIVIESNVFDYGLMRVVVDTCLVGVPYWVCSRVIDGVEAGTFLRYYIGSTIIELHQ